MENPMKTLLSTAALSALLLVTACASMGTPSAHEQARLDAVVRASVDSTDRPAKDREQDAKRKPYEVLRFAGVKPGENVIDMFSATGWYAELLSRVVGPKGHVFAQNIPSVLARFGDKPISERVANNRLPNVERWDKPLNEMGLPKASLDGAMINLVFHDFYWITPNVDGVLGDLHAALKPGAWVAVIDHSAPAGTRETFARDVRGQHRIDEAFVKERFAQAGFVLEAESDMLRNAADTRAEAFFAPSMQGKTTDKFVLRFRRP
jgi:predicted methyltransferase